MFGEEGEGGEVRIQEKVGCCEKGGYKVLGTHHLAAGVRGEGAVDVILS